MAGQRLKEVRQMAGWTVYYAAKQFNISESYYRRLEKSTNVPARIADFMEIKAKEDPRYIKTERRAAPAHLTAFRQAFHLTQEKASDLLGVSRITWNRWENGQTAIPKHMLHTLRGMVAQLKSEQQESKS